MSDGFLNSIEFPIFIKSPQAPVSRSPQSGEVILSVSPKFEWNPVSGVPFYHFILTDRPVEIIRDDLNNLQIEGANIIYQVITDKTEIFYGEPDPSGFFNQVNGIIPPLLNGKIYNWIILNNYGNNPALSSIIQSGVQSFTVNVQVNILPPTLVAPASNEQIADEEIYFFWQPVNNVNYYQFELFEIIEEGGSSSTFPVWQTVTTNTNIKIPARQILKSSFYEWQVIALDVSGKGSVSEKRNFTYFVPSGTISIYTRSGSGNYLPRANIIVKPVQGSGENNDYLSSDSGVLTLNVQPGEYQISATKSGFEEKTVSINVGVYQTESVILILELLSRAVFGNLVSASGQPLPNAKICAIDLISRKRINSSSDIQGNFRIPLSSSIYQIYAFNTGYSHSDSVLIDLTTESEIVLTNPLVLEKYTGELLGRVVTQNSIPVFGVHIIAQQETKKIIAVSDDNGVFQLKLGIGTWRLQAQKAGYNQENTRFITISENQTILLNPDLVVSSPAAMISGFVSDGNIGVGSVKLRAVPSQGISFTTTSNAKGNFFLSVKPGTYDLHFQKHGYLDPIPLRVELNSGQSINDLIILLAKADVEVSGFITSGGNPVSGAIITNGFAVDTSRITGFYNIVLPEGNHRIYAHKKDYFQIQPKKISVTAGDILTNQDIELSPQPAVIKGTVTSGGLAVVEAKVFVIQNNDTLFTFSDQNGDFNFSLAPGIWNIIAKKEGFQQDTFTGIALQPGQTIQGLELIIYPNSGTITGHVQDSHGNSIAETQIICQQRQKQVLTNNAGDYQLILSPGIITVKIAKKGYSEQQKNLSVVTGQIQVENFTLTTLATVSGKITDGDGIPINQAEILAIQGSDTLRDVSDYTGEYLLYLPEGNFLLIGDKLGYSRVEQQISITDGQILTKNIQLQFLPEEFARISGEILVENSVPLSAAAVKIFGKLKTTVQTDINGVYLFDQLESGFDYTIQPTMNNYFFLPDMLIYQPLSADQNNQNFIASLFGDLSANCEVSSFDGSLILRLAARKDISPYFSIFPRDSIAADVSGNGTVSSFDASLIFRYSVGLITTFPAEQTFSYPEKARSDQFNSITVYSTVNRQDKTRFILNILTEDEVDFFSLDAEIGYSGDLLEPLFIKLPVPMQKMTSEWNANSRNLRIAMAGYEKVHISDTLFSFVFKQKRSEQTFKQNLASIEELGLDEGSFNAIIKNEILAPENFLLLQNYPNPFNQSTLIKIQLPAIAENSLTKLKVEIYNLLGQKIATLANDTVPSGYYTILWSGLSDSQQSLASGIYLMRVKYGRFNHKQKLVIVR